MATPWWLGSRSVNSGDDNGGGNWAQQSYDTRSGKTVYQQNGKYYYNLPQSEIGYAWDSDNYRAAQPGEEVIDSGPLKTASFVPGKTAPYGNLGVEVGTVDGKQTYLAPVRDASTLANSIAGNLGMYGGAQSAFWRSPSESKGEVVTGPDGNQWVAIPKDAVFNEQDTADHSATHSLGTNLIENFLPFAMPYLSSALNIPGLTDILSNVMGPSADTIGAGIGSIAEQTAMNSALTDTAIGGGLEGAFANATPVSSPNVSYSTPTPQFNGNLEELLSNVQSNPIPEPIVPQGVPIVDTPIIPQQPQTLETIFNNNSIPTIPEQFNLPTETPLSAATPNVADNSFQYTMQDTSAPTVPSSTEVTTTQGSNQMDEWENLKAWLNNAQSQLPAPDFSAAEQAIKNSNTSSVLPNDNGYTWGEVDPRLQMFMDGGDVGSYNSAGQIQTDTSSFNPNNYSSGGSSFEDWLGGEWAPSDPTNIVGGSNNTGAGVYDELGNFVPSGIAPNSTVSIPGGGDVYGSPTSIFNSLVNGKLIPGVSGNSAAALAKLLGLGGNGQAGVLSGAGAGLLKAIFGNNNPGGNTGTGTQGNYQFPWDNVISGLIGYAGQKNTANQLSEAMKYAVDKADPFAGQRGMYQGKLADAYNNPNGFLNNPLFTTARDQAIDTTQRKLASSGFNGSGNAGLEMTKAGTTATLGQAMPYLDLLSTNAGAKFGPGAAGQAALTGGQAVAGANNAAMGNLGYAASSAAQGQQPSVLNSMFNLPSNQNLSQVLSNWGF